MFGFDEASLPTYWLGRGSKFGESTVYDLVVVPYTDGQFTDVDVYLCDVSEERKPSMLTGDDAAMLDHWFAFHRNGGRSRKMTAGESVRWAREAHWVYYVARQEAYEGDVNVTYHRTRKGAQERFEVLAKRVQSELDEHGTGLYDHVVLLPIPVMD